jgi:hypothetical protein
MRKPRGLVTRKAQEVINRALGPLGYQFITLDIPHGQRKGYFDVKTIVQAAQDAGQTVCEFVERLADQRGATAKVVAEMKAAGLQPCERVVEIGPGTGRYLERVAGMLCPKQYDIYEIDADWADWLVQTFSPLVVRQPTDGRTLPGTPDDSCGLVHAHGVFVYLSLLEAYQYFVEMLRVCRPQGWIVFDFFKAESFDEAIITKWLAYEERYPVALMQQHIEQFFSNRGCELIREFDNKYGHGFSHYVVFQKVRR